MFTVTPVHWFQLISAHLPPAAIAIAMDPTVKLEQMGFVRSSSHLS